MNRREALRAVSFIMGGTVLGAELFLSGCETKRDDKKINSLFTESEVALLNEVGDTIIPETDTPGAKAVDIGAFMAMMVVDTYTEKDQKVFKEGIEKLRSGFEEEFGHSFMEAKPEERQQYLTKLNAGLSSDQKSDEPSYYFRMMKELTILGFFSSEIGSTMALRYIETPGRYEACIPYEKGDRAWAL